MKSATFPSLRVEPELRQVAESLLIEGESLSQFVEQAIRANIERRLAQREFVARGLVARESARQADSYVEAAEVVKRLEQRLAKARQAKKARK